METGAGAVGRTYLLLAMYSQLKIDHARNFEMEGADRKKPSAFCSTAVKDKQKHFCDGVRTRSEEVGGGEGAG